MNYKMTLFSIVTLLASNAHAAPLVSETKEYLLNSPSDLMFQCSPGTPSNGHNFPTPSSFELFNLDLIVGDTNVRSIGTADPQERMGDHCAELSQEFASILPAKLVLKRTVTETIGWVNGICVKGYDEELVGTIGSYELEGSDYFNLGEVAGGCTH